MKKRFLGLLCAAALLAMPAPVLAAENSSTVTEISTDISVDAEIDIRVKYEETASQNSTSIGSSESVTLQDGTTVTVESDREADREIRAMVILLNNAEGDAYEYASRIAGKYGKDPYMLYVMFSRDGAETEPEGSVTVTVSIPDGYENAGLYFFTGNAGEVVPLTPEVRDGQWIFTLSKSGYLAAVLPDGNDSIQDGNGGQQTTRSDSGPADKEEAAQPSTSQTAAAETGDETDVMFWFGVLCCSVICFAISYFKISF